MVKGNMTKEEAFKKLLFELEKGVQSAEEQGWLSEDEAKDQVLQKYCGSDE